MGRRKDKFKKMGLDDFNGTQEFDKKSIQAPKKHRKSLKEMLLPEVDTPTEQDRVSSRFTVKKTSRQAPRNYAPKERGSVPKGIIKPHILMVAVLSLAVAAFYMGDYGVFSKLSNVQKYFAFIGMSIVVYIIPSLIYCFSRKLAPKKIYIKLFSPSAIPMAIVSLLLMMSIVALEKYYIAYNFSYRVSESVPYGGSVFETLLTSAILPAVFETLFVNGVLQSEYSRFGGGITGIVASGFVFGLLHLDFRMFVIYFSAGLVLGALTHATGSVFPAVLVHFANNAAAIFLTDSMTFIASERIGGTFLMTVLTVFCFVFALILLQMFEKSCKSKLAAISAKEAQGEGYDLGDIHFLCPEHATGRRFLRLVLSPAMILGFVVIVLIGL